MLGLIFGFIAVIGLDIVMNWLIYVNRGHAQPDDRSKNDHPIITGPDDALANIPNVIQNLVFGRD